MEQNEDIIFNTSFFSREESEGRFYTVAKVNYLALLHLRKEFVRSEIQEVRTLIINSPDIVSDIHNLMSVKNWRPHIVGCFIACLIDRNEKVTELLWSCLDKGSWVSPQIAATLSLLDNSFIETATLKLEGGSFSSDAKRFMALFALINKLAPEQISDKALNRKQLLVSRDNAAFDNLTLSWREKVQLLVTYYNQN